MRPDTLIENHAMSRDCDVEGIRRRQTAQKKAANRREEQCCRDAGAESMEVALNAMRKEGVSGHLALV